MKKCNKKYTTSGFPTLQAYYILECN